MDMTGNCNCSCDEELGGRCHMSVIRARIDWLMEGLTCNVGDDGEIFLPVAYPNRMFTSCRFGEEAH